MTDSAFYDFLLASFQNMETCMAHDASIYVFHADTEGLNFRRAFSEAGFYLSRYMHLEETVVGTRAKPIPMAA
jgi:hypothetical protein